MAQLNSATDGSAVTSGTTTVYVLGDGGTQATGSVGSGAATHEGHGCWSYAPAQAETNYDHVAFTFVNSSAVAATVQIYPSFPQTGDNFARLGAPAGASVSADVAAVKTDTAAVKVQTDKLGTMMEDAGHSPGEFRLSQTALGFAASVVWDSARATHANAGSFGEGAASVQGNVTGSVASVAGAVASVTGNVGGSVASVTARVTANTDQLAGQTVTAAAGVTFPTSVASPTNITAGTITTATNLTNAPTAGDFTSTMKTSIGTAVAASAVASVTGNVGGNVVGSVGSVTGNVGGNVVGTTGDATNITAVKTVTDKVATTLEDAGHSPGEFRFSITALSQAPSGSGSSPATIAAAVVDQALSGHTTAGTVGAALSHLDADISTRLPTSSYTAPDNSDIAAIKVKTDNLPSDPADASDIAGAFSTVNSSISTLQSSVNTIGSDVNTQVPAIKLTTDKLATMLEDAGHSPGETRFTTGALIKSPAGSGGGATAAEVWDELIAGHLGAGSTGKALSDAGAGGNPWNNTAEGGVTFGDIVRGLGAEAFGTTSIQNLGNGQAIVTFNTVTDPNTPIIVGQAQNSERTSVTFTP